MMSEAVVTAALFANLGGGVNAGSPFALSSRTSARSERLSGPHNHSEEFGEGSRLPARAQADPVVMGPGSARAWGPLVRDDGGGLPRM